MVMFSFLYACYLQTYSKRVALIEILPILEYEHRVRGLEKSFFTMTAGVSKESCFDATNQEQPKTISTTFSRLLIAVQKQIRANNGRALSDSRSNGEPPKINYPLRAFKIESSD